MSKTSARRPDAAASERAPQRLILAVPAGTAAARLNAALGGGDVAAVILAGGERALVEAAQDAGSAALLARTFAAGDRLPWPLAHGADGLHAAGAFAERHRAVDTRPEGVTIGAAAATRHEAMSLGEAGADYLHFGRLDRVDEEAFELAAWWQALFEVPAVLAGPADAASVAKMIATRAEFIAVNVFELPSDPAESVAAVCAQLRDGAVSA